MFMNDLRRCRSLWLVWLAQETFVVEHNEVDVELVLWAVYPFSPLVDPKDLMDGECTYAWVPMFMLEIMFFERVLVQ